MGTTSLLMFVIENRGVAAIIGTAFIYQTVEWKIRCRWIVETTGVPGSTFECDKF